MLQVAGWAGSEPRLSSTENPTVKHARHSWRSLFDAGAAASAASRARVPHSADARRRRVRSVCPRHIVASLTGLLAGRTGRQVARAHARDKRRAR